MSKGPAPDTHLPSQLLPTPAALPETVCPDELPHRFRLFHFPISLTSW